MRHSYDQSEYTKPGEEFTLPPEQSATLSGGRRLADRFGLRGRSLAEPDEAERQAAEVLAEEGPAGEAPGEELTASAASSASADEKQAAAKKEKRKRSLLLQFAAVASSVVLVTNSFGIDFLGMDGLFNDSVILGEASTEYDSPERYDADPEPMYGDLIPFGGDRTFPRLNNNDWTVTQQQTVDANNKYIVTADFAYGSMGEQAMVTGFLYSGRKDLPYLTGPIPTSFPSSRISAESPSIYYDEGTNTLTLHDYHGTGLMVNNMGQDFTIRLEGDNVLTHYLLVACGSVTITGNGGIFINEDEKFDYGIHVIGQWSNAHLLFDEDVKFDISGRRSIFRVTSTCSEKPIWYKSYSVWAEVYQAPLKAEDPSIIRDDPETYHSWLIVGANSHTLIVNVNNSYVPGKDQPPEPGETKVEPATEAPVTSVRLPVGGDSSFPMLPNPLPDSVGADGQTHASQILVWQDYSSGGFSNGLPVYDQQHSIPTGRDDISYDPASNTLTLNNFTGGGIDIRNMGSSFKIHLIGRNELLRRLIIFGDLTSGSVTFTGDGYLAINTSRDQAQGLYIDAGEAAACIMIESSVTMDIYGSRSAFGVANTTAEKAIYCLSDQIPGLMQKRDGGEKGTTLGSTVYDWASADNNGQPVLHVHFGGEAPPETEPPADLPGLPVGGDSSFPVLPNPDPNTPVPTYGILDEDYIQVFDRESGSVDYIYTNRNQSVSVITEPGLSYNQRTNTLTLNNYHGAGISANMMGNSFTVELIGENVLTQDLMVWGFYTAGSIRFTGNGSLSINSSLIAPVGLDLEGELSESCVMIEEGVTLDIYGATYALLVNATNADKAVYLLSPAPIPGIRQAAVQEVVPDVDFVSQETHYIWTLLRSDTGEPALYCHIGSSANSR